MSKIKQSLSEEIDITDPKDNSSSLGDDTPTAVDWAMAQLEVLVRTLEDGLVIGYETELKDYIARLKKVVNNAEKPF